MTLMEFFTATGSSPVAEEVIAGLATVTDDVVGRGGGGSGNNALLLPADILSKGEHVYIEEQEIQDIILFPKDKPLN